MKKLINNFKNNLNNNPQKTLLFILASFAFVELLALIYASHIIYLSLKHKSFPDNFQIDDYYKFTQKDKSFSDESQAEDYYILATYLSQDSKNAKYDEKKLKVIRAWEKYLILDPQLKIANKDLFDKISKPTVLSDRYNNLDRQQFHDYRNSCLSSIINSETVNSFSSLKLDSDTAYIKRGKIRFFLEDYKGAINDFTIAQDLNQNNKNELNQSIALAYFELGNPKYFKSRDIRYNIWDQLMNQERLFVSLKYNSNSAISFNPNFADAHYLRGYLSYYEIASKFSIGQEKRNMKEDISNAIEKGIFNDSIFIEMIDDFKNAVQNDPFFYIKYPYNTINPCPVFSDEYPGMIKNLSEKITANPNDNSLYYQRALIYLKSKKNQKAIEDLNIVTQSNSSNNSLKALAYYGLWLAHYKQKNYQEALENINQIIKIYPDFADFYAIRGLTYYDFSKLSKDTKDLEKAIEDCSHAIKLHKGLLKKGLLKKPNPDRNSRYPNERNNRYPSSFLDEYPHPHATAYFIRGLAYYDLENQTQALSDYLQALPRGYSSMWKALVTGDEGGGVRDLPSAPGFPP